MAAKANADPQALGLWFVFYVPAQCEGLFQESHAVIDRIELSS